jgi:long-chain acyl-CoA synthetase
VSVALTFGSESITYEQLGRWSAGVAEQLKELGVGPGDRVALWMGNHPAFAAAMYGTWQVGGVVVPVHSGLTKPEATHVLSDSGAKVAYCGPDQEPIAREIEQGLDSLEHVLDLSLSDGASSGRLGPSEDDGLALIAYTAGTSGVPKGAMLTHAQLRANLDQMKQTTVAVGPDDVAICVVPLFHIFGLNVVLNLSVDVGARLVLVERFDPAAVVEQLEKEGVTVLSAAPQVYVVWMAMDDIPADAFSGVRVAVSGAAPLPKETLQGFKERFGLTIWEGYGLTETAPALTTTAMGGVPKPACVGRPLPGVELRLLDPDGDEVEPGDPGEIVVRGPNLISGVWHQEKEPDRV